MKKPRSVFLSGVSGNILEYYENKFSIQEEKILKDGSKKHQILVYFLVIIMMLMVR